eukprot:5443759-Alexandrium_andersonii.AAC.1
MPQGPRPTTPHPAPAHRARRLGGCLRLQRRCEAPESCHSRWLPFRCCCRATAAQNSLQSPVSI